MLALFAGAVQSLVETDPMRAPVVLAEDMTAGCIVMQENAGRAHGTDIPDKDHDDLTWSLIRLSKNEAGSAPHCHAVRVEEMAWRWKK